MHPDLNMSISIEHQLQKLTKCYQPQLKALLKAENNDEALFEAILEIAFNRLNHFGKNNDHHLSEYLPIILLLKKKYRLAWLVYVYHQEPWDAYLSGREIDDFSVRFEQPYLSNLKLLWEFFDAEQLEENPVMGLWRTRMDPYLYGAAVSPDNDQVNEHELHKARHEFAKNWENPKPGEIEWEDTTFLFNPAPEARYVTFDDIKEFHLRHDSLTEILKSFICATIR